MHLELSNILTAIVTALISFAVYCNLPAEWLMPIQTATADYLGSCSLQKLDGSGATFKAQELWEKNGAVIMVVRRPGCFLCREEAGDISSLKPQLDETGVPLYAVVHEKLGVEEFKPYFKGEVFFDEQKVFYGPEHRRMLLSGLFKLGVWRNAYRAKQKGFSGNLQGDGTLLGGVFVLGSGSQGILFEHREKEFGNSANGSDVMEAVKLIKIHDEKLDSVSPQN